MNVGNAAAPKLLDRNAINTHLRQTSAKILPPGVCSL